MVINFENMPVIYTYIFKNKTQFFIYAMTELFFASPHH